MKQFLQELAKVIQALLDLVFSNPNWTDEKRKKETFEAIEGTLENLLQSAGATMPTEIEQSYLEGVTDARNELGNTAVSTLSLGAANIPDERFHTRYIQDIQFDTMNDLQAAIRTAQIQSIQTIERTLEEVQRAINSGLVSVSGQKFIRQKVADAFVKEGLTSFITSDNKKLPLDYYVNLVVNTKVREARVQGKVNQLRSEGVELVRITNKSGTCPICARHKNLVVSLTGDHEGFPNIDEIRLPPLHPHCRCFIQSYFIDIKNEDEIEAERAKWRDFDPDKDPRTAAQKREYNQDQERKRKLNAEKKQFARWQAVLGGEAPRSLGAFRRMKGQNTVRFQKLQAEYNNTMREVKGV